MLSRFQVLDSICVSRPEAKVNEDGMFISSNLVLILDGATGLDKNLISEESDAYWLVSEIIGYFQRHFTQDSNFLTVLNESIFAAREKLDENILSKLNAFNMPSAGMAAIQIKNGYIQAFRTGDCKLHVKFNERIYELFEESKLSELDKKSINNMKTKIQSGETPEEARAQTMSILRENRSMMNKPDGYSALSLEEKSIQLVENKKIKANEIDTFLLTTDGFYSVFEDYRAKSIHEIFEMLKNKKSENIIELIRTIEQNDASLQKYPRLKKSDDATAAIVSPL